MSIVYTTTQSSGPIYGPRTFLPWTFFMAVFSMDILSYILINTTHLSTQVHITLATCTHTI